MDQDLALSSFPSEKWVAMKIYDLSGQAFVEMAEGDLLWIAPMEEVQMDEPDEVLVLICKALERKHREEPKHAN